jgi:RNA polymerase sigma factor (sigma-70 family)
MDNHQLILDNMPAIKRGVERVTASARLSKTDVADLIQDAYMKLLDGRMDSFDPAKGNVATFVGMVAWQVARDAVRSMNRGGQFSGYMSGYKNANIDAPDPAEDQPVRRSGARTMHRSPVGAVTDQPESGRAVLVSGVKIEVGTCFDTEVIERQWTEQARGAVAEVLAGLTEQEQELYSLMASGDFDAATYAAEHGISPSTAHVRANRLRAKLRAKLAA